MWGQELSTALNNFLLMLPEAESEEQTVSVDRQSIVKIIGRLKAGLRELWDDARVDVFDSS